MPRAPVLEHGASQHDCTSIGQQRGCMSREHGHAEPAVRGDTQSPPASRRTPPPTRRPAPAPRGDRRPKQCQVIPRCTEAPGWCRRTRGAMNAVTSSPRVHGVAASDDAATAIEKTCFDGDQQTLACACAYLLLLFDGGHLGHRPRRWRPTGTRRRGGEPRSEQRPDHPPGRYLIHRPGSGSSQPLDREAAAAIRCGDWRDFMGRRYLGQKNNRRPNFLSPLSAPAC